MIEVQNLSKQFGGKSAVRNLSFRVEKGTFGLIGPNGAGKTTTLRILATLLQPTGGNVRMLGIDNEKEIRRKIGYMPENAGFYEALSARKNLRYYARLQGIEPNFELLKELDLSDKLDDVVKSFSKGMKQKLSLARALMHDPQVLLLDEPTAHLDPEARRIVGEMIKEKTTVLASHNLEEVERICDSVAIINTGLIAVGTPEELKRRMTRKAQLKIVLKSAAGEKVKELLLNFDFVREVSIEGSEVLLEVDRPFENNSLIIEGLIKNGFGVVEAQMKKPSLEDAYVELLK
jgi:ABC-2 type transport system ATP-binding protein